MASPVIGFRSERMGRTANWSASGPSGPTRRALRGRERAGLELAVKEAFRIDRARQRYVTFGRALKPHPRVVGLIADQDDKLAADGFRGLEASS